MKKILMTLAVLATSSSALAVSQEFTSRDLNNDGKLSVQEWIGNNKNSKNPQFVATRTKTHNRIDQNGDGFISKEEWTQRKNNKKN